MSLSVRVILSFVLLTSAIGFMLVGLFIAHNRPGSQLLAFGLAAACIAGFVGCLRCSGPEPPPPEDLADEWLERKETLGTLHLGRLKLAGWLLLISTAVAGFAPVALVIALLPDEHRTRFSESRSLIKLASFPAMAAGAGWYVVTRKALKHFGVPLVRPARDRPTARNSTFD